MLDRTAADELHSGDEAIVTFRTMETYSFTQVNFTLEGTLCPSDLATVAAPAVPATKCAFRSSSSSFRGHARGR